MKRFDFLGRCALPCVLLTLLGGPRAACAVDETDALLERLLQPPTVVAASGYEARLLVPPGRLYDPLWMHPRDGQLWFNDDGGEEGDKGSRLLTLDGKGSLRVVVPLGRMLPVTGFDFAPPAFGPYAGQIYALTQAVVAAPGTVRNHVVQRIEHASDRPAEVVCTLREVASGATRESGFGVDARFGPAGTPFADRFFALAAYNNTIYQMNAAHECRVFVTFDGALAGAPMGLAFAPDGQSMLVTLKPGGLMAKSAPGSGMVVRVGPDGRVDPTPVARGFTLPGGVLVAPAAWGGGLLVTDLGDIQSPVPMTQALAADGKVYRVAEDGKLDTLASGLVNPLGLHVVDEALWVTDINGDFIAGKRELPDGFIVAISPRR